MITGGVPTATNLLSLPFRHIYFTGAPEVGKIVMKAAAKNLTSVTLELGGKCPVIVDETANLKKVASRLTWSKFINCGQACLSTDYLIVHERVKNELIGLIKQNITAMYSENPKDSSDLARIVSDKHFERINSYLKDAIENNGHFECGGKVSKVERYIEPTIVTGLDHKAKLLKEEIFGPVLPVLTYSDKEEIPNIVSKNDQPLAIYIFSKDKNFIKYVINHTKSGGTVVNNAVLHIFNPYLPFGGVNKSGVGKGFGKESFLAFTNPRVTLYQRFPVSAVDFIHPPFTKLGKFIIKTAEKYLS